MCSYVSIVVKSTPEFHYIATEELHPSLLSKKLYMSTVIKSYVFLCVYCGKKRLYYLLKSCEENAKFQLLFFCLRRMCVIVFTLG
jgi:hypothetical protein